MKKYAVIGDPVAHSRSPGMQNAAFEFYGLGSPYGRIEVRKERFAEFVDYAKENLAGFNLTVPHKAMILPYLAEISPEAEAAGSVNTVTVKDGKFSGTSTDGYGLAEALKREFNFLPAGKTMIFLGCGGAVNATAFHFAAAGAKLIRIANRTLEKAELLAQRLRTFAPETQVECTTLDDLAVLRKWFAASDVLIQATSVGLHAADPSPVDEQLFRSGLKLPVFDTIYSNTALQRAASAAGLPVANGKWMLIYQGARSFELWTGKPAPVEVMEKGFTEDRTCQQL